MRIASKVFMLAAFLFIAQEGNAQWKQETYQLKGGWNAIYLHLDLGYGDLEDLLPTTVEEVWLWTPEVSQRQFINDPSEPDDTSVKWRFWRRNRASDDAENTLSAFVANAAYLIKMSGEAGTSHELSLTGIPVPPRLSWNSQGQNLVGFSTPEGTSAPSFSAFFNPDPTLAGELRDTVFRYPGGPLEGFEDVNGVSTLVSLSPRKMNAPATTKVRRGEAFWMKAQNFNGYTGPFDVELDSSWGIDLTPNGQYRLHVRNRTDEELTVTLRLVGSGSEPTGLSGHAHKDDLYRGTAYSATVVDLPYMLIRDEQRTGLGYGYDFLRSSSESFSNDDLDVLSTSLFYPEELDLLPMKTSRTLTLDPAGEPGAQKSIVIGMHDLGFYDPDALGDDNSPDPRAAGTFLAGIIRLTDDAGPSDASLSQVDIPIRFTVKSFNGLYVGTARVNRADLAGNVTNAAPARTYDAASLRLIYHRDTPDDNEDNIKVSLLQRVYFGYDDDGLPLLTTREDLLPQNSLLARARRISAVHLPWNAGNPPWDYTGTRQTTVFNVTNRFDQHASNPFLHTFHPDHDNLDARFTSSQPQGQESYTIIRRIEMSQSATSFTEFDNVTAIASTGRDSGTYQETITLQGKRKLGADGNPLPDGSFESRIYRVQGDYSVVRVTGDIELRTTAPTTP